MALAAAAAGTGTRPRFVFASSIAVFGEPLPASVDDATPLSPRLLYGAHKAMIEQWLATLTRRGEIDAISLRLSGIVARPRGPSGMKSAFLSELFHALNARQEFVMPVSAKATCWLTSVDRAVRNLAHALTADLTSTSAGCAVTLPALRVSMGALVKEVALQTGAPAESVSYVPDTALEAAFGALPPLFTPVAERLGFSNDGDLSALVAATISGMKGAENQHTKRKV